MYTATIIGCGSIGALKDDKFDYPSGENILTHAHACWKHSQVQLKAFIDYDIDKANKAYEKWVAPFWNLASNPFLILKDIPADLHSDIFIVASPTHTHKDIHMNVIEQKPKLVIGTKPLGANLQECYDIVNAYEEAGIPLYVDYLRRYDSKFQHAAESFFSCKKDKNDNANIYNAILHYDQGLITNGCHGIDLINWFLGDTITAKRISDVDYNDADDPTIAAIIKAELCPHVLLLPSDGREYTKFELDIWHRFGRTRFTDRGKILEETLVEPEKVYNKSMTLGAPKQHEINLTKTLYNVIDIAVKHLNKETVQFSCTGQNALEVWRTMDKILTSKI